METRSVERPVVVVVTWQGAHLLERCLAGLRAQTEPHDVLVVDNASTDGTATLLAEAHPEVQTITLPRNVGFAGGVDAALGVVSAPLVALLNNDAVPEPGWLAALVAHLRAHPEAAAVTSRMMFAGARAGVVNNTGVVLLDSGYGTDRGLGDDPGAWTEPGEVFGFCGGAALLRREPVQAVGGFPAPFFLYYEDTDVSWRLRRAGWTVRYEPAAVVHHEHAASSDVTSVSFAFHNERNRLVTLARNAPVHRAVGAWMRFLATTASLVLTRLRGRPVPSAHQFDLAVRARAFGSALALLPWALRSRRPARSGPRA